MYLATSTRHQPSWPASSSFPVGHANGLPLGAQFIAPPFQEHAALSAVHTYQNVTDWHNAQPDLAPGVPGA